jgi:glyoxylate carboligase
MLPQTRRCPRDYALEPHMLFPTPLGVADAGVVAAELVLEFAEVVGIPVVAEDTDWTVASFQLEHSQQVVAGSLGSLCLVGPGRMEEPEIGAHEESLARPAR